MSISSNTNLLHSKIIDIILNSSLNIQAIPDDVERELYYSIFTVLEEATRKSNCFKRLYNYLFA